MVLLVSITAPPGTSKPGFGLARPVLGVSLVVCRLGFSARVRTSFRSRKGCRRYGRCKSGIGLTEGSQIWCIRACEGRIRGHVDQQLQVKSLRGKVLMSIAELLYSNIFRAPRLQGSKGRPGSYTDFAEPPTWRGPRRCLPRARGTVRHCTIVWH